MKPKNKMCSPDDCTCGELRQFEELVIKSGEVCENGLTGRIKKARLLAFYHLDGKLIATAGIKKPYDRYKNDVFTKTKASVDPKDFKIEFGWAFTEEDHRGKKLCPNLTGMLMSTVNEPIFATTGVCNIIMQRLLKKNGFHITGKPYQGRSSELFLYVKN